MVWLPVFGIFTVRTDADAYDCARELYEHRERIYIKKLAAPATRTRVWLFSRTLYQMSCLHSRCLEPWLEQCTDRLCAGVQRSPQIELACRG